ncbi:TPA: hypothetical protein HA235_05435 [Candidatus Woesearchaeota archaeon]|nr:hypothetical protein [Candidatus Woesearchaeota archaeon]HIH32123.1 hypothetical protein [Candidatus Woesearchaeota archaeon]HIJ01934.1 hypothetical protein [Candidatus Woesearchaeota archaeon]
MLGKMCTKFKRNKKWTIDEINILRNYGQNHSSIELKTLLPNHSRIATAIKCRRLGIYKTAVFKSKQGKFARNSVKNPHIILNTHLRFNDLSCECRQILLGSMLGDGFITKNAGKSKNYCFRIHHSEKQKDYLLWKANMLQELKPKLSNRKLELFTPTHSLFTEMRLAFYRTNTRKNSLHNSYINELDWLGLLIWYLDDGGLQSRKRDMCITSKLFNHVELEALISKLNINLNIHMTVKFYKHKDGLISRIRIPAMDRTKIVAKFENLFTIYNIPQDVKYKITLAPLKQVKKIEK